MPFVKNVMVLVLVHVYQNILVILIQAADPNVLQTQTAPVINHVQTTNVETHALEHVALTQSVVSTIMHLLVHVCLDTAETLPLLVISYKNLVRLILFRSRYFYMSICTIFLTSFSFFHLAVTEAPFRDPCQPSPCGPYSQCRVINGHAVCSCQANYIGSPPACRPECMVSADCPQNSACINQKCQDPCPGTCGINARCQVVNHNPICSCSPGYTGEPFVRCIPEESKLGHYPALS